MMQRTEGQVFLSLVLLIGGITLLIGTTVAFFATSFIDSGYGYQAQMQADAVATSGAEDGLLQLQRNTAASSTYTFTVASNTAAVSITQNSPAAGQATILSVATVGNHTRKMSVIASINTTTSQVTVISWQPTQ